MNSCCPPTLKTQRDTGVESPRGIMAQSTAEDTHYTYCVGRVESGSHVILKEDNFPSLSTVRNNTSQKNYSVQRLSTFSRTGPVPSAVKCTT